jgi:hypothetical protein
MPTHSLHHYVPKFLLEQWHTGADDKLSVFRWAHGKLTHHRYKAKSVAKAEHLYSMRRSHAQPDVNAEKDFLGPHVDEPAAIVHRKILAAGVRSLNDDDKRAWSAFLVSMMLRVPAMMQHMRDRGRQILAAGLDEAPDDYLAVRGHEPEPTLRAWVEKHHPDVLDDLAVMTLPNLVFSKVLNGAFLSAKWGTRPLLRSRFDLLVSDKPLVYVGAFEESFLVTLPLAPRLAFLAFNEDATWDNVMSRSEGSFVREMNLAVAEADTYVYAASAAQESFVRKYLPKR